MTSKELLHRYLYLLLLDVRHTAYESGDKRLFELTSLLHNLPLKMCKNNVDLDELLQELINDAEQNEGLTKWLENNKR